MLPRASVAVLVIAAITTVGLAPPAAAAPAPPALRQPANLAVRGHQIFVADSAASTLSRLLGDGSTDVLAAGPQPGEVAGVALSKDGRYLAYTSTERIEPNEPWGLTDQGGTLTILGPLGFRRSVDLAAYEDASNPDADIQYGMESGDTCTWKNFQGHGYNPSYNGRRDSRPASVVAYGNDSWLVADAGGNDVLKVDAQGAISTVAVLPKQPVYITAEMATGLEMSECVWDVTYDFEAVPTDIEVSSHGGIYVSTESERADNRVLGPRGHIYRVHPRTGAVTVVASGLDGATNLAVSRGKIFVAERYADRVSVIKNGRALRYRGLPGALSVEARGDRLYAGAETTADAPGRIVRLR